MDITLGQIKDILTIVMSAGALVFGLLLYRLKGEFASKADIKGLGDRVELIERDQAALAIRVEQVPTHKDIETVSAKLAEVAGDVKALDATIETGMRGLREQLSMLVKHHLEKVS